MPIYEYRCDKCDHEFEAEQRITDEPIRVCPKCRARKVRRLISQTSFVLKGGGWYSDLYGSSKAKAEPSGGDGASSGASASKSESSDSGKTPSDSGSKKGSGKKKSESKKAAA